jgi:hypothetical protein
VLKIFVMLTKFLAHHVFFLQTLYFENRYLLNRSVFGIVYITICFFSAILGLKNTIATAIGFFVLMMIITYVVDRWITTTFVNPSITLALTNARIIDEENKVKHLYHNMIFLSWCLMFCGTNNHYYIAFFFTHIFHYAMILILSTILKGS